MKLRIFEFSGDGEFAKFDTWDEGLTSRISKEVSFAKAREIEEEMKNRANFHKTCNLPETPEIGVYHYLDEHDGSRYVYGFVIADNENSAVKLLKKFDKQFKVVKFKIKRYKNPKNLKIFEFSGDGIFNKYFDWDEGLESYITKKTSFRHAKIIESQMKENYKKLGLPESPKTGVFYNVEEERGIRSVYGFVIEKNLRAAKKLLKEFDSSFVPVKQEEEY